MSIQNIQYTSTVSIQNILLKSSEIKSSQRLDIALHRPHFDLCPSGNIKHPLPQKVLVGFSKIVQSKHKTAKIGVNGAGSAGFEKIMKKGTFWENHETLSILSESE